MNVLITGSTGFVGNYLSSKLNREHVVDVLNRAGKKSSKGVNQSYNWDYVEHIQFEKYEAIIHLVGKAHDVGNEYAHSDEEEYFKVNAELPAFLLKNAKLKGFRGKFIFMSSIKAMADEMSNGALSERLKPCPNSLYGRSKLKGEELLQDLNFEGELYILRPALILGPKPKGNLKLLSKAVQKHIPYLLGSFKNKRSYLSIENLKFVIDNILLSKISTGTYHLADSEALSTVELVLAIAQSSGKKVRIVNCPKGLVRLIAKLGDYIPFFPLDSHRLKKLTESYVVDNSKLINELPSGLPASTESTLSQIDF